MNLAKVRRITMKTDWTTISTDDLLNWDGAQTDQIARYDRIMRHRETVTLENVNQGKDKSSCEFKHAG